MTQLLKLIEGKEGNEVISIIHKLCLDGCLKAYSYRSWNDASIFIFFSKNYTEFTMLWFQYIARYKTGAVLQQCISNQLKGFYDTFLKTYPQCSLLRKQGMGEVYIDDIVSPIYDFLKRMFMASDIEHTSN